MVMYYLLCFYLLCFVLLLSIIVWNKLHTKRYGLFTIRTRRGNKNTLFMSPAECPTGDMVAAVFFIKLRKTLRILHVEGRQYVDFETHIIRKENVEQFLRFLQSEGYRCESIRFRKTLLIHLITIKVALFFRHRKWINMHHESAQVEIYLQ